MWILEQWSDVECSTSEPVLDVETSLYTVQCSCDALGTLGYVYLIVNPYSAKLKLLAIIKTNFNELNGI